MSDNNCVPSANGKSNEKVVAMIQVFCVTETVYTSVAILVSEILDLVSPKDFGMT